MRTHCADILICTGIITRASELYFSNLILLLLSIFRQHCSAEYIRVQQTTIIVSLENLIKKIKRHPNKRKAKKNRI